MFVPPMVINLYVALASACLVQARYLEMWPVAMSLFIAHYCTLYLRSAGDIASTPGQLATQGLARGVQIAKAAGGVSVSIQPSTQGYESWGAWQTTGFGELLLPIMACVGAGPMWIW
jgi:hypothetical protein